MKTKITKLHYDKNADFPEVLKKVLDFASIFYGLVSELRNTLYDKGYFKAVRVDAEVISVGNLTTGGVGKTPVVAEIAKYFIKKDEKVAIISRGYGGTLPNSQINVISDGIEVFFNADMAGDEPFWLASQGFIVITGKDRIESAQFAIENFGVTKIILDDGFQHRKIYRDLDIVLIDSEKMFGNEKILPAGPLREGFEAFDRIDKLVVVSKNTEHSKAEKFARVMGRKLKKDTVIAYTEPDFCYNIITNEQANKADKFVAISAIGQPEQFYNFLGDFDVEKTINFADHYNYTQLDIENLKSLGISNIITTEKDAVKLMPLDLGGLNVFALKLKVNIDLDKLLS